MYELKIRASASEYAVTVGLGCSEIAYEQCDFVIADEVVQGALPDGLANRTVLVHASEADKSLTTCERVLGELHALGARRGSSVLAVGGGVVQDVATLVASLYMRGLPWAYVPTTAMAMTDSCIGGKSSINLGGIKNLVGNIYPPTAVFVDAAFLTTLPVADRVAGLAEAVKICFARSPEAFENYLMLSIPAIEFGADGRTDALIAHTLESKKWFVEIDEFDQQERQMLNFGHLFAHALEPAVGFSIPHGVAVALGVLAAMEHPLACRSKVGEELGVYCRDLLATVPECIAVAVAKFDRQTFRSSIASDKMNTRDAIRLVLPAEDGRLAFVVITRSEEAIDQVEIAMRSVLFGASQ